MENKILVSCKTCNKVLCKIAQDYPERGIKYCRGCYYKSDEFLKKVSKGWFKKGQKPMYTHEKGHIPWNKGKKTGKKAWNSQNILKSCKICKKEFTTIKYKLDHGRGLYCTKKCFYMSTKGRISPIRGQKFPDRSGTNHPGWKGGKSSVLEKLRKSFEYEEWRKKVFERDLYTCQHCGEIGGLLNADHIMPFAYFPDLRFELSNGRTLCLKCHQKTDTYMGRAKALYEGAKLGTSETKTLMKKVGK